MLLLVSLLHLLQSSQDTVSEHMILMKPHPPKSIGVASNTLDQHIDMHPLTISRDCWYWNCYSISRVIFLFKQRSKVPSCSLSLPCWYRPQMLTPRLWKQSPIHYPLNSTWTGRHLVSVRHSIPAFEEVVDWRQSCSGQGPPASEHNHHHHCEG